MHPLLPTGGEQFPYSLRFEYRESYLIAYLTCGQNSVESSLSGFSTIAKECHIGRYKRVLVVDALEPELSFVEASVFASRLFAVGLQGLTVAVVRFQHTVSEAYLFSETVAWNNGVHMKVFTSMAAAELWLTKAPIGAAMPRLPAQTANQMATNPHAVNR